MTSKKIPDEWKRRKTRYDPPDLEEAITAAQSLTSQIDAQIEIAARLMGISEDEVRPAVLDARPVPALSRSTSSVVTNRQRIVTVEHRSRKTMVRS